MERLNIEISENLKNLASALDCPLYIVGGYVRDNIIGYKTDDIDIASECKVDKMLKVCASLGYKAKVVNEKLGTILIIAGDEKYEYTPFRVENYIRGQHSPESVEFVNDINVDCRRRDFTANCIYYNVLSGDIFDPYGGIQDIQKKKIRCVETPVKVFSSDGLRILRLVRFACTLGFAVDKSTLKTAKEMTFQLRDITGERKKKELDQIVIAESVHGLNSNNFVDLFNKLNIYKYLFMLPCEKYSIRQNKDAQNYFNLTLDKRFVGFVVLFLLNKYDYKYMPYIQIESDIQYIMGNVLKCSKEEMKQALDCYVVLQDLKFKPLNNFIAVNYQKLTDSEKLVVNAFCDVKPVSVLLIYMINNNIPINESKLDITNDDIIELIGAKYISKVRRLLLEACLLGRVKNNKDDLLEFIKVFVLK